MVSKSQNESREAISRSSLACDACRRRKIKGDSTEREPGKPCSKCEAADLECKFTYTRKKRRPNLAPKSRKYGIDQAQVLVENIISALDDYSIPQDSESVRDILISLAKYARSLELRVNRSEKSTSGSTTDSTLVLSPESNDKGSPELDISDKEDSGSDEELAIDFKNLSLQGNERHFGRSSNYLFLHTAIEYRPEQPQKHKSTLQIRCEMWDMDMWKWVPEHQPPVYIFPENDLLLELTNIFFNEISPYSFPLLHRPTFERAVKSGFHLIDQNFGATVLAVCALASRNSNDPRNLINATDCEQLAGWKWFRQIQLVRPSFEVTTSVYELQLYCLATSYLSSTTISDSAWPLIGLGIRLAHERGAHRAKPGQARTVESELWARAFWCLVGLDIIGGLTFGRPPATTPNDFDVDQIADCDDEEWESSTPFVQPEGKPSKASFGVYYHRLLQIAGSIQRSIYAIKRPDSDHSTSRSSHGVSNIEWNQREVMKHDSALNEWLDSLPEHLRWDPHRADPIFLGQSVILHSTFYWVQTTLHKKFVMRIAHAASRAPSRSSDSADSIPDSQLGNSAINSKNRTLASLEMRMSFPSLAVCANAARCSVNIAQAYHQRNLHPIPEILPLLGNTSSVLLVALWRSKHSCGYSGSAAAASRKEWADLQKCFTIMAGYEKRHQWAGRLIDKFMALAKAEHLDEAVDPPQSQGVKRNRPDDGVELDVDLAQVTPTDWTSAVLPTPPPPSQPQQSTSVVQSTDLTTTTWTPFYPTSTGFGLPLSSSSSSAFTGSSSQTAPALNGMQIWSDPPSSAVTAALAPNGTQGSSLSTSEINAMANAGMFGIGPNLSFGGGATVAQRNQTRPLQPSEVGNGILDGLADIYQRTGAGTAGLQGLFNMNSNSNSNTAAIAADAAGFDFGQMNSVDLEEWNMFMRNVDDALFEAGLGR
ncbi:hypothetical protein GYMLUDRAFT_48563 [Collybiopsis luxurians FD-317 M1]|uniref:Zn(2)-C6 fungal-type domain-containing protein n=1 Tax=Collybiopsis luxurians FD-317 M1 TaxID=944289 RepID=A0A0D0BXT7_9AGAR|nr:hypothetical protein GYMLUDRAFT_48563 [Collybiopsis luxurians FD-317 M1]